MGLLDLPADVLLYMIAWCMESAPILRCTWKRMNSIMRDRRYRICRPGTFVRSVTLVRWAPTHAHMGVVCPLVLAAARRGNLEVLEAAVHDTCKLSIPATCEAASGGHTHILNWMRFRGCPPDARTAAAAAGAGLPVTLRWLHDRGFPCDSGVYGAAAAGGYLDILEWARSVRCSYSYSAFISAAYNGHLHVLRWADSVGIEIFTVIHQMCTAAIVGGHIHILQWLYHETEALEHLCNIRACELAASVDDLDVLQWLHACECPWGADVCYEAARNGNWDMLRWAHDHGCPWDERTCAVAARHGLDRLRTVREGGCPWDHQVYESACAGDDEPMFTWAYENGCPLPPPPLLIPPEPCDNPACIAHQQNPWTVPSFLGWATRRGIPRPDYILNTHDSDDDEDVEEHDHHCDHDHIRTEDISIEDDHESDGEPDGEPEEEFEDDMEAIIRDFYEEFADEFIDGDPEDDLWEELEPLELEPLEA
jgi:hypothetical protein